MSKKDLIERLEYIKECLGEEVLINEIIAYLSTDEMKDLIEHIERCWDIR